MDKKILNKNVVALMKGDKGDTGGNGRNGIGLCQKIFTTFDVDPAVQTPISSAFNYSDFNLSFSTNDLKVGDKVTIICNATLHSNPSSENILWFTMWTVTNVDVDGSGTQFQASYQNDGYRLTGLDGTGGDGGPTVSFEVGSVTTLPAGSDATVENVGTDTNITLNFGIPQGADGVDGTTFTPSIENGVLSFTNDGGKENPQPYDLKQLTSEQVTLLTTLAQSFQVVDGKIKFSVEIEAPSFNAVTS